jgi:hypothetical protein
MISSQLAFCWLIHNDTTTTTTKKVASCDPLCPLPSFKRFLFLQAHRKCKTSFPCYSTKRMQIFVSSRHPSHPDSSQDMVHHAQQPARLTGSPSEPEYICGYLSEKKIVPKSTEGERKRKKNKRIKRHAICWKKQVIILRVYPGRRRSFGVIGIQCRSYAMIMTTSVKEAAQCRSFAHERIS